MPVDRVTLVEVGPRDGLQNEKQPIDTALFGLANLHTPAYPSVMDFDFATHDGRNGFYAFTSRPDTKGPLSGGSVAGAPANCDQ